MSQTREDEDGYTIVKCVHCGKLFKFLNASPKYIESIAFCSKKCRDLYFWFKGKAEFEKLSEGKKND
jgi:endogenous inhibitor of DNA gyrase (YacG/DUF329 family)